MDDTSMLSFYRRHSVAPVRQETSDLDAHFARRRVLYQQLGIPAVVFTGRDVLEIGPGTGQNALFVTAQNPSHLVLVEPNPKGVEEILSNFAPFPVWRDLLSIQELSIEQYRDTRQFDIVLCEGLVGASGQVDAHGLLSCIAAKVRPGGLLVVTCIDYVGYLAEMLRRLLGFEVAGHLENVTQRVAAMLPMFSPHLSSLRGMSRRYDDWIIDNLINPASIGKLIGFEDLLGYLGDDFDVLSSSPRFIVDWTWYKNAALEEGFFNRAALECYRRNLHNFIDYRCVYPPREEAKNHTLSARCEEIHHQIGELERTRDHSVRQQIIVNLRALQQDLSSDLPTVAAALAEMLGWLLASSIDLQSVAHSENFGTWFGRGQTYISFVRRKP